MGDEEPTKICVRVLSFEGMIRYYLENSFCIVIETFFNCLVWVFNLVNWCIARSLARWFGIPIMIYWSYVFMNIPHDQVTFEMFGINAFGIAILGCFILISWVEIPYKEKKILERYSDYMEQQKGESNDE